MGGGEKRGKDGELNYDFVYIVYLDDFGFKMFDLVEI